MFSEKEKVAIYNCANMFLPLAFYGCLIATKIVRESDSPVSSVSSVFSVFLLIFACDLFFVINNKKYWICKKIPSVTYRRVVVIDGVCLSIGLVVLWVYLFVPIPVSWTAFSNSESKNRCFLWLIAMFVVFLEIPTLLTNKKIWKAIQSKGDS